ncbi:Nicotinate-nucleotide adenylyltransferase [hydrothermal vent metagenome]|uniref:Nicotinate-nucleotide adenylyltransferase n=1 Tax=hydrothermal vent metagenome TaxID=652676 RepID=A0A3B0WIY4_9ZZZZ
MIGIFGGTFDPVHYGHIKPALSVKQALNLTQLRFIPNRIPPHRETPWLGIEQRLAILHCALDEYPDVLIDERELNRDGPSYMVDTLKSLQLDFPDEKLCLIIGMDVFFGMTSWFEWRAVFDLCDLVVTTRPGFEQSEIKAHMSDEDYAFLAEKMTADIKRFIAAKQQQESPKSKGQILLQSVPQLDISATKIRDDMRNTEKVSQWMPPQAYQKLRGFIYDN